METCFQPRLSKETIAVFHTAEDEENIYDLCQKVNVSEMLSDMGWSPWFS